MCVGGGGGPSGPITHHYANAQWQHPVGNNAAFAFTHVGENAALVYVNC